MTMAPRTARTLAAQERITVDGFLADSVAGPGDGKIYVLGGGWNILHTQSLPTRHPRLGLAVLVTVPYLLATNEAHRLEIHLEDADRVAMPLGDAPPDAATPDGKLRRLTAEFAVGRPVGVEPGDEQVVGVAINLDGLVFERAGSYSFVIAVDGQEAKRLRFRVNLLSGSRITVA
jgi:hypothetical protein